MDSSLRHAIITESSMPGWALYLSYLGDLPTEQLCFIYSSAECGFFAGSLFNRAKEKVQILHCVGIGSAAFKTWIVHKRIRAPFVLHLNDHDVSSIISSDKKGLHKARLRFFLGDCAAIVVCGQMADQLRAALVELGITYPPPVAALKADGYIQKCETAAAFVRSSVSAR